MSIKRIAPHVREISAVVEKFVGKNFVSHIGHYTVTSIVDANFSQHSEIWKRFAKMQCSDGVLDVIPIAIMQTDLFEQIHAKNAEEYIVRSFEMIVEVEALVKKYRLNGTYSEMQATFLMGRLLESFAETVFYNKIRKNAYKKNQRCMDVYSEIWIPYEKYLLSRGILKQRNEISSDSFLSDTANLHPRKIGKADKSGCLIWLAITVLATLYGYFISKR